MKLVIGIDIGGTNLRFGSVTQGGTLYHFEKKYSAALLGEHAVDNLSREILEYMERYQLAGRVLAVAVGVPSMVSKDKSFVYSTPNLKGLENIDLGHMLKEKTGLPVFVDRDVNYLLLNDIKKYGLDTKKKNTILGMYLGTGFGNAIYINGQIYAGKNGAAGELGHIPFWKLDEVCACGNIGCAEKRCSGLYLQTLRDKYFKDTDISEIFTKHRDTPVIQEYVDMLAIPISTEITILDPDYVIMGGGVMIMKDFPMTRLTEQIKRRTRHPYPSQNLEFVFPEHTHAGGVIGGAYAVFAEMQEEKN